MTGPGHATASLLLFLCSPLGFQPTPQGCGEGARCSLTNTGLQDTQSSSRRLQNTRSNSRGRKIQGTQNNPFFGNNFPFGPENSPFDESFPWGPDGSPFDENFPWGADGLSLNEDAFNFEGVGRLNNQDIFGNTEGSRGDDGRTRSLSCNSASVSSACAGTHCTVVCSDGNRVSL